MRRILLSFSILLLASVPALAQSYGFVSDTPTVQNAAYSAGQSLGGLQTVSLGFKYGTLQQFKVFSKGGSTVGIWAYIWQKNPSNTTCTDKANFAVSAADNANLVTAPFQVIPALGVSANDATTYASQGALAAPFINTDTTQGANLYVCLLAAGSVTPASTTDLTFSLQGLQ